MPSIASDGIQLTAVHEAVIRSLAMLQADHQIGRWSTVPPGVGGCGYPHPD